MNPVHRTSVSLVVFAALFEGIGFAAGGSLNPATFFTEVNTGMLVVLSVLATLIFLLLLNLLGLYGYRLQGLSPDTLCGYRKCPFGSTPLWSTIGFAVALSVVKCQSHRHPRGQEWFHRTCWHLDNVQPASLGQNVCRACREAEADLEALKWG